MDPVQVVKLVRAAVANDASDLHLKSGSPPCVRIDGRLTELPGYGPLTGEDTSRMAAEITPECRSAAFEETNEADFAYEVKGVGRFRVNLFRQRGAVGIVMRHVKPSTLDVARLGLPPIVQKLAEEPRGLVLVTGPTGSGKTTTIAAMIDHINSTRRANIVTIEDPIEILHDDKRSIVNQREIGTDTEDYRAAMKRVLRQDPDVIFLGELRDSDTAWAALGAAETGHLVLSTLHTIDSAETVNRLIDFFPPDHQRQARVSLAASLRGVVSQRLLERADGTGRVPAVEVLVVTGRVFDRIIQPDGTHQIPELIAEGTYYGMQTFDQSLFQLYRDGLVTLRDAMAVASNPHDFRVMLAQSGIVGPNALELVR